jgi:hypothetical protein
VEHRLDEVCKLRRDLEVSVVSTGPLGRHATATVIKLRRSLSSGEIQILDRIA